MQGDLPEKASALEKARQAEKRPLGGRLLWFAGLWLAGVAVLAVVAYGIRAMIL